MKNNKLFVPLSMTAALVGLVACAVSCAKKSSTPENNPPAPPPPATNTVADNTAPAPQTNSAAVDTNAVAAVTNAPGATNITNPPPAETTVNAPEPVTLAETNLPGHLTVVEMPTNAPVAPTNFYPVTPAAPGSVCLSPVTGEGSTNFFLRFRGGYEHIYHGDNNDSYWLSAKLYAYGDGLRQTVGKNAWLIPDADLEVSSQYLPKPDYYGHPGSDNGLRLRADFTWPWFHWTSLMFARTNSVCPFCQPLVLGLGPTLNLGFDHLYDESEFRFARYAGVRLTFNRSGYIEYTVGDTDGLAGTRQQVVAEIPFYESRDGEVRYYLRGLWNHGASNKPDDLEGGVFLEMPFSMLAQPEKWGDLVPFAN